jgi:hypothetical protein
MPQFTDDQYHEFITAARRVFVPYAPVELVELFQGRQEIIRRVVREIDTPGRHVVLYGDRGVGKTSLAGLISFFANRSESLTFYERCSSESRFDSILAGVLKKLGITQVPSGATVESLLRATVAGPGGVGSIGAHSRKTVSLEPVGGPFEITPQFVSEALAGKAGLIVIDEYDRASDAATSVALAELIKHLSDEAADTKIVVVGVAESVSELFGSHPSVCRCVAEIELKRMSDQELLKILEHGFHVLGLYCDSDRMNRLVGLSDGFPHFTHLMGLMICEQVAERLVSHDDQPMAVVSDDYRLAISEAVSGSRESLRKSFEDAIATVKRKSDIYQWILEAMAFDCHQEVQINQIVHNINEINGSSLKQQNINYHLGEMVKDGPRNVLTRVRPGVYKFRDPMMRAYVRMHLEEKRLLMPDRQLTLPFIRAE